VRVSPPSASQAGRTNTQGFSFRRSWPCQGLKPAISCRCGDRRRPGPQVIAGL